MELAAPRSVDLNQAVGMLVLSDEITRHVDLQRLHLAQESYAFLIFGMQMLGVELLQLASVANLLLVIRLFAVQFAAMLKLVHLLIVLPLRMLHLAPADFALGLSQELEVGQLLCLS